jgi:hypothetical protein
MTSLSCSSCSSWPCIVNPFHSLSNRQIRHPDVSHLIPEMPVCRKHVTVRHKTVVNYHL